jgi:hypothetical protein
VKTRSSESPAEPPTAVLRGAPRRRSWARVTPLRLYVAAFVLFVGAIVAVGIGQFSAGSTVAPLASIGLSAGAVLLTILAVVARPRS